MKPYAHFDPVVMAWMLALEIAFLFVCVACLAWALANVRAAFEMQTEQVFKVLNVIRNDVDELWVTRQTVNKVLNVIRNDVDELWVTRQTVNKVLNVIRNDVDELWVTRQTVNDLIDGLYGEGAPRGPSDLRRRPSPGPFRYPSKWVPL